MHVPADVFRRWLNFFQTPVALSRNVANRLPAERKIICGEPTKLQRETCDQVYFASLRSRN
jgi:hypothetical protein